MGLWDRLVLALARSIARRGPRNYEPGPAPADPSEVGKERV